MKVNLFVKICSLILVLVLVSLFTYSQSFAVKARSAIENSNPQLAIGILENSIDSLYLPEYTNALSWYVELLANQLEWEKISLLKNLPQKVNYYSEFANFLKQFPKQTISFNGDSAEIKFSKTISGTPKLLVNINGVESMFWFDTGAGITVLSDETAQKSGLKPSEQDLIEIESANGSNFFAPAVMLDECTFQGIKMQNHYATILPKSDLQFKMLGIPIVTIRGIIGWPFFQNFNVSINNKRNVIIVKPPTNKHQNVNFFWLEMPLVKCTDENGKPALYAYDTGAGTSCLFKNYADRTSKKGKKKKMKFGSAGGVKKIEVTKYENHEIEVSDKKVKFFLPTTIGLDGVFYDFVVDGLLGNMEFKPYIINFDMNAGYFQLK